MYAKHCAASVSYSSVKKLEKIYHLRGLFSLGNCFRKMFKNFPIFDRLFLGENKSYNNEIVSNVRKTSCRVSKLLF